jgi:hypothetical protein
MPWRAGAESKAKLLQRRCMSLATETPPHRRPQRHPQTLQHAWLVGLVLGIFDWDSPGSGLTGQRLAPERGRLLHAGGTAAHGQSKPSLEEAVEHPTGGWGKKKDAHRAEDRCCCQINVHG